MEHWSAPREPRPDYEPWSTLPAWVAALALVLFISAVAGNLCSRAWGATYNFTFNNVEQGPGSTTNPAITITGGIPSPRPDPSPSLLPPEASNGVPAGSRSPDPGPESSESPDATFEALESSA